MNINSQNNQDILPSPPEFSQIMYKQIKFSERKIHGILIHHFGQNICFLLYKADKQFNILLNLDIFLLRFTSILVSLISVICKCGEKGLVHKILCDCVS